jgi:hypothetical protein
MGDALMAVRRGQLPANDTPGSDSSDPRSGLLVLSKVGDEHLLMRRHADNSPPMGGTYFIAVGSQGANPDFNQQMPGTGPTEATLSSYSAVPVKDLGTLGASDLTDTVVAQEAATTRHYRFVVPEGTATVELRLEGVSGSPQINGRPGEAWPAVETDHPWYVAVHGGLGDGAYRGGSLITLPNPTPGVHTFIVYARGGLDASYTVRIRNVPPPTIPFDGGEMAVSEQGQGTWRFFRIDVPGGPLGWDLRVENASLSTPDHDLPSPRSLAARYWCCW